jgi:anti-sigma B factor antagonist
MNFSFSTATIEQIDGFLVSVEGKLDTATAEQLADPTQAAVIAGTPLVLDLTKCSFIDSKGLEFVLHIHKALAGGGTEMALVVSDGQVRDLLSITAIDLRLRIFAELDHAVSYLGANGRAGTAPGRSRPAPMAGRPSLTSLANERGPTR